MGTEGRRACKNKESTGRSLFLRNLRETPWKTRRGRARAHRGCRKPLGGATTAAQGRKGRRFAFDVVQRAYDYESDWLFMARAGNYNPDPCVRSAGDKSFCHKQARSSYALAPCPSCPCSGPLSGGSLSLDTKMEL